jgi:acyl-CoA hydrolase
MASNAKFKQFVVNLSVEDQHTVIERQSRLLPAFIMQEVSTTNNPKVIRKLESRLKQVRLMMSSLIANGKVI